jgi:hypothetical protein
MASKVYWTAIAVILSVVMIAGVIDFTLWLTGGDTVTSYLRRNPRYFYWPALILCEVVIVLVAHLFGEN